MQTDQDQNRDLFAAVTQAATSTLSAGSLDESRSSPHAAQLVAGFRWLRFSGELEPQFRRFRHERYLIRTRIAMLGAAVLLALFSLRDLRLLPDYVWHVTVALRLGAMVPSLFVLFLLSFTPRAERWYEAMTAIGTTVMMGALAAAILFSHKLGAPLPYEGLMLVMVFTLFLAGLRFYTSMLATLLTASGYVAARVALDFDAAETLQQGYYVFIIVLIGLVGSYSLELSQRANFLTEHVALYRATRDSLTHLYNRRAAFDHLDRAWRLGFRERKPIAVALLDVDNFKAYNDSVGHLHGDTCLAEVAAVLRDRIRRPMDLVARYGGEEFMIVLYDVSEDTVERICEDVRGGIKALRIPHPRNIPSGVVTISAGAAWIQPAAGTSTMETLIESADQALYAAKAAGRDRYIGRPAIRL